MTGLVSYVAGLAAEDIVSNHLTSQGFFEKERRWRGAGGEIDLIFQQGPSTVFIEVKKSRDFESAAARVSSKQLHRIAQSAAEYLSQLDAGLDSDARIDVALVNAQGMVEILENVTLH